MRTAASVGEALAAGAIFTVPAFVMVNVGGERLWTSFNYWETSLILLVGGLLGILFIILLRRTLAVDAGPAVPGEPRLRRDRQDRPEGRHRRPLRLRRDGPRDADPGLQGPGRASASSARASQFVKELPASVIHHMDSSRAPLGDVTHRGALVLATPSISPALIGVGYIIGFELSAINFAGRRPRLAGVRAARPLPQPRPRPRSSPGAQGAPPAHRARLLGLVQPDPADRGRRDAGRAPRGRCGGCAPRSAQAFRGRLPPRAARPSRCATEKDLAVARRPARDRRPSPCRCPASTTTSARASSAPRSRPW